MAAVGSGYKFHITGLFHDEIGFPKNDTSIAEKQLDRMIHKIEDNFDDINIYEEFMMEDAEQVIISFGGMVRSAKEAVVELREKGEKVGMFIPKTVWPFPYKQVNQICKDSDHVFVAEMNLGQMLQEVNLSADNKKNIFGINKANGEIITPEEIISRYWEVNNAKQARFE